MIDVLDHIPSSLRALLAALVGVGTVLIDTRLPALEAHPFGALMLWVISAKILTGWAGGAVAAVLSLYVAGELTARFPGLPLEAAGFVLACILTVANEYYHARREERLRSRLSALEPEQGKESSDHAIHNHPAQQSEANAGTAREASHQ